MCFMKHIIFLLFNSSILLQTFTNFFPLHPSFLLCFFFVAEGYGIASGVYFL